MEQIKSLCAKRLPAYYRLDPINDIQILTPMQRGVVGVRNLNEVLQETLNPAKEYVTYGGVKF